MPKPANDDSSRTSLLKRTLKDAVNSIYKVMIFTFGKRRLTFGRHLARLYLIQHFQPQLTVLDHPSLLFVVVEVYTAFGVAGIMTLKALLGHQRSDIALITDTILAKS